MRRQPYAGKKRGLCRHLRNSQMGAVLNIRIETDQIEKEKREKEKKKNETEVETAREI